MIKIQKIVKKDIPAFLEDDQYWHHSFLPVSKHRLLAHYKNPTCDDDDVVLILSYLDDELVGYMGVFTDKIKINSSVEKIGWLSTWWVHPKTKGKGVGREILNSMYEANHKKIGISQFTPSAKRVYDKSGYFVSLKNNVGVKAVLRSNLIFVLPTLFPWTKKLKGFINLIDTALNATIQLRLKVSRSTIRKRSKALQVEYLNVLDKQALSLVETFGENDISPKSPAFFAWLKANYWVLRTPILEKTFQHRYTFSMYDKDFDIFLMKIIKNGDCIAFIVLQKRNYVAKVLFSYYDNSKYTQEVADIIKLQSIALDTREIITYDTSLTKAFNASSMFLYKTNKKKASIISKAFGVTEFDHVRMNLGDGDCSFT